MSLVVGGGVFIFFFFFIARSEKTSFTVRNISNASKNLDRIANSDHYSNASEWVFRSEVECDFSST